MHRSSGFAQSLADLASPRSVAVVGASDEVAKMGGAALRGLRVYGFNGAIYPVNPTKNEVQGIPSFASLSALPSLPDTVVVAVPAAAVPDVVDELVALGIRSATVISAGFGEGAAGPAGLERDARLRTAVAEAGISLLGPNTAGLANILDGYVPRAVFNSPDDVKPSGIAIVTQSGAVSNMALCRLHAEGHGVGFCVATGDELDLRVDHWLDYVATDERITTVLCVVEGLRDGQAFATSLRTLRRLNKVCIVLKVGKSVAGSRVAMSHTGALSGDARVFEAMVEQCGGVNVDSIGAACALAALAAGLHRGGRRSIVLTAHDKPIRLGVLCGSGGEAALLADMYTGMGIGLPDLSSKFEAFVSDRFAFAAAGNPFDITGEALSSPQLVASAARAMLDEDIDLLHIAFPTFRDELGVMLYDGLGVIMGETDKPVIASTWTCPGLTDIAYGVLRDSGAIVFDSSERVPQAVAAIESWRRSEIADSEWDETDPLVSPLDIQQPEPDQVLALPELRLLALSLGLRTPDVVDSEDLDSLDAGAYFVKAYMPHVIHKKAAGLISGPHHAADGIRESVQRMWGIEGVEAVEVERVVSGIELLIGIQHEDTFDWTVTVGLGGTLTELFPASIVFVGPSCNRQILGRFESSDLAKAVGLQAGARAEEALDLTRQLLDRVIRRAPEIANKLRLLEFNPVIVDPVAATVWAVDAIGLGFGTNVARQLAGVGH